MTGAQPKMARARGDAFLAIAARRARENEVLRVALEDIAVQRKALDAREREICALLGEATVAVCAAEWQCFDCDSSFPAVGTLPDECPFCGVSPFAVRS